MQTKPFRIILHLPRDAPLMLSPHQATVPPLQLQLPLSPPTHSPIHPTKLWVFSCHAERGIYIYIYILCKKRASRSQKMSQCFLHLIFSEQTTTTTAARDTSLPPTPIQWQLPPQTFQWKRERDASALCPFQRQRQQWQQRPKKASLRPLLCTKWQHVLHKSRLMSLHWGSRLRLRLPLWLLSVFLLRCLLAFAAFLCRVASSASVVGFRVNDLDSGSLNFFPNEFTSVCLQGF